MALLETQARETKRGLSTSTVLLGEVHAELVQDISRAETPGGKGGSQMGTGRQGTKEGRKKRSGELGCGRTYAAPRLEHESMSHAQQ